MSRDVLQDHLSRDLLQEHLTPGALDAFLGGGLDPNDNIMAGDGGEEPASFDIPNVMLVDMPIAALTPTTKIVHLGKADNTKDVMNLSQPTDNIVPPPPPSPSAGTSGVTVGGIHAAMEVEVAPTPTPTLTAVTPVTTAAMPETAKNNQVRPPMTRGPGQVKKGTNTKNRNTNTQPLAQADANGDKVQERMSLLKKITDLMEASYGSRRNEMEVWGHYVGLKASRIPVGRKRDKMLVRVEELLNEATYDDDE